MSSGSSKEAMKEALGVAKRLSGKNLMGGKLVGARGGATFDVASPATRQVVGQAALSGAADVDEAVSMARASQKAWGRQPVRARAKVLLECARAVSAHTEELARVTSLETGKAIRTESRVEAGLVASVFEYYAGLATELKGESIPFAPNALTFTVREPVGVVGAIIPWNAPLLLMALKVAPALCAGNAVVLKSSELAPFGALRVAEILSSVLPPGLLNVLSGDGLSAGRPLAQHPSVAKLSFTGSVGTGRAIYREAAEKLVPVTLELGGKSPMIVCEDMELERAVDGAIGGMRFTRQGQSCTAASRIFVHESVMDAFVARLKQKLDAMVMGDPMDDATDIGTIISAAQHKRVADYIALGKTEGTAHECATLPTDPSLRDGLFVRPTLFTGLPESSRLVNEEIFGPVTALFPWNDLDDTIRRANGSEYGLSATVWTRSLQTAMKCVREIEAGIVQVNGNAVVQPNLPVGGRKTSGLGREANLAAMLEHFTHEKTVVLNE